MKKIVASFAVALIPVANACTNEGEKAETMQAEAIQSARMAESNSDENVYTVVENSPEFAGGITALYTFLGKNIKYPKEASEANVRGKVLVTFVVGTNGAVRDVKLLKGLGYGTDEEAIRVVKAMPNWKPGSQDGKNVAVKYNLPISFQLE
jgi:protein TonB